MKITVHGTPAPQGSKRAFVNKHTGRANLVESSAGVKPWREAVKWAATACYGDWHPAAALRVSVMFYLPRPQGHYGTGRNACTLKPSAPTFPAKKPDVDKLIRSTLDGLGEAGIWVDDSRVVAVHAMKLYADGRPAGAEIEVLPI